MKQYFLNILIGLDQFTNVVTGGSPDETISSRLWRHRGPWWINRCIDSIDWIALKCFDQENHCQISIEPIDHSANDVI